MGHKTVGYLQGWHRTRTCDLCLAAVSWLVIYIDLFPRGMLFHIWLYEGKGLKQCFAWPLLLYSILVKVDWFQFMCDIWHVLWLTIDNSITVHMCWPKCVLISCTKYDTPTAAQKFQNFPLPQRLHWSCWWLPIFWIVDFFRWVSLV